jgi:hypothetical protein
MHLHAPQKDQSLNRPCRTKLGINEVDERIWLVSFMHYDLGYIDPEHKTSQAIDNPFDLGLSPMSQDRTDMRWCRK